MNYEEYVKSGAVQVWFNRDIPFISSVRSVTIVMFIFHCMLKDKPRYLSKNQLHSPRRSLLADKNLAWCYFTEAFEAVPVAQTTFAFRPPVRDDNMQ